MSAEHPHAPAPGPLADSPTQHPPGGGPGSTGTLAGSAATARYYRRGEGLLPRYEWFKNVSGERAQPVGRLRPNDRGLFDVLGNALEPIHRAVLALVST